MMKYAVAGLAAASLIMAGCAQTVTQAQAEPAIEVEAPAQVNLILIYSLQDGVTPEDFEAWVRDIDYPQMRALARVDDFRTYRTERLLIGEGEPSVQYIETFAITDLPAFIAEDMGGETVQSVMGQFMGFAEAPQFIVVDEVK